MKIVGIIYFFLNDINYKGVIVIIKYLKLKELIWKLFKDK